MVFIYSFCGWAMECVVIRIQLGRWENRGFAKLPFCVIYGFGVFIAYHLFQPIEHNYVALYIWGCIAATIFEYLTAQVMLRLFDEVWWDYTHKRLIIKEFYAFRVHWAGDFLRCLSLGFSTSW